MISFEDKHVHLEMIQNIISRLSHNSFMLKSWSIVLVSAMFALSAKDSNTAFMVLAYFPVITFWLLDGYYLQKERTYRELYDLVRVKDGDNIDFSMDTELIEKHISFWFDAVLSKNIIMFHGVVLLVIIMVTVSFI